MDVDQRWRREKTRGKGVGEVIASRIRKERALERK